MSAETDIKSIMSEWFIKYIWESIEHSILYDGLKLNDLDILFNNIKFQDLRKPLNPVLSQIDHLNGVINSYKAKKIYYKYYNKNETFGQLVIDKMQGYEIYIDHFILKIREYNNNINNDLCGFIINNIDWINDTDIMFKIEKLKLTVI